jgi:hypothetical protein
MATDLEWEVIARRWDPASRSCILELRDRIAALESLNCVSAILKLSGRVDALEATQATCPHVRSSDEGTSYCSLVEQSANSKPTPNDCQIGSSADTGILPMIISETGSDDEPETERIICSSISGGADYVNGMPRGLSLERIQYDLHGALRISARYVQALDEVAMPAPAAPGGLVERVRDAMLITQSIEEIARAAIREVADWLEQRRAADAHWITVALLREAAGR